jgi:hypothetical protein
VKNKLYENTAAGIKHAPKHVTLMAKRNFEDVIKDHGKGRFLDY